MYIMPVIGFFYLEHLEPILSVRPLVINILIFDTIDSSEIKNILIVLFRVKHICIICAARIKKYQYMNTYFIYIYIWIHINYVFILILLASIKK